MWMSKTFETKAMARKVLFPVRVSWSLRRAPRAYREGQREHCKQMRRMKNPPEAGGFKILAMMGLCD